MEHEVNNGSLCKDPGDVVSFIYDELNQTARRHFENHLLECEPCTEELIAVSDARYSVIEWRKDAFDGLALPEITIPYERSHSVSAGQLSSEPGFIERAWAAVQGFRGLTVAGSFAAVAVVLLGGLLVIYLLRNTPSGPSIADVPKADTEIAANRQPDASLSSTLENALLPNGSRPEAETAAGNRAEVSTPDMPDYIKAADKRQQRKLPPSRIATRGTNSPRMPSVATGTSLKVPKLSGVDDDRDDGLRLSDLFDQVGTK